MHNKKLTEEIAKNELHIKLYETIIPILESEGTKMPTKRLATKIESMLRENGMEMIVSWNPDHYGSKRIAMWGGILTYNDMLDVTYNMAYGDMWRCKTLEASILDTLESTKARHAHTIERNITLTKELENFDAMVKDYAQIAKDYKAACKEFRAKYGSGEHDGLSYTVREELERITSVKIDLA